LAVNEQLQFDVKRTKPECHGSKSMLEENVGILDASRMKPGGVE
jgi:hypothetical protein